MTPRILVPLLAAAFLAGCDRTPDRPAVERIVHDYILAHPEIVPQAMDKLRTDRAATAIAADRPALERPFAGAWAGSARPKATLVMFSDYACGYCKASAPDIARLIAAEPDLRVVWREIPVLGPPSEIAAKVALAAAKAGHYPAFHLALFAAGRPDAATVMRIAGQSGLDPAHVADAAASSDIAAEIEHNLSLAGRIGVTGTPAFVIGDTMLSGAVGYEALKRAVDLRLRG